VLREQDVVITTAAVPGHKAPILITKDMVEAMCHNSVIVDIAAERGGNCELTRPGEILVHNGVTIMGLLNLPSSVAYHASQMLSSNITAFTRLLLTSGNLTIDTKDEIVRETLITHEHSVVHPRVADLIAASQRAAEVSA
jgi:NAD(P) transhydrogenase subunit alpha